MIEMPSVPETPTLEPEQIRGLISYAENMAAFLQAEMELFMSSAGQRQSSI